MVCTSGYVTSFNLLQTSLCFLVDCTGSMRPWIDKVKENIKIWSEGLHKKHTNMELHVGFVRYTDHDQPKDTRTTWIDFTTYVQVKLVCWKSVII